MIGLQRGEIPGTARRDIVRAEQYTVERETVHDDRAEQALEGLRRVRLPPSGDDAVERKAG